MKEVSRFNLQTIEPHSRNQVRIPSPDVFLRSSFIHEGEVDRLTGLDFAGLFVHTVDSRWPGWILELSPGPAN